MLKVESLKVAGKICSWIKYVLFYPWCFVLRTSTPKVEGQMSRVKYVCGLNKSYFTLSVSSFGLQHRKSPSREGGMEYWNTGILEEWVGN